MRVEAVGKAPRVVAAQPPALGRCPDVARVHDGKGRAGRQIMVRKALGDQSLFQTLVLHVAECTTNVEELHAMRVRISDQGLLDLTHLELDELVAFG